MSDAAGLLLLGLVYGTTVCSLSCLPYLGPYLLSTGEGFRDGVASSLLFLSGKLLSYATLGGVSALSGRALTVDGNVRLIIGATLVIAGLSLPFVGGRRRCRKGGRITGRGVSLLMLGISTSLIPCPPLAAVFLLAAGKGSVLSGVACGLAYGLGLTLSPILLTGGALSLISRRLKAEVSWFVPYMQALSALMIVIMGIRILVKEV